MFASRPVNAESLGTWSSTTSYPVGVQEQSCGASGGYIYCVGGWTGSGNAYSVYYALISSYGVGAWSSTRIYPIGVNDQSCAVSGIYIYCVGGYADSSGLTNAVYYSYLSSIGGVGGWASTTGYPFAIYGQSCAASGGYIYCVGGYGTGYTGAVYYAPISSSGVGAWSSTTSYPFGVAGQSCAASGGYIYCVGGYGPSTGYTYTVYYAPISSSGVGAWSSTTSYPTGGFGPYGTSCDVSGGYIYCVTGYFSNAVYYAPISSSGVGAWSSTASYPITILGPSCVVSGWNIYCVGGEFDTGALTSAVYYDHVTTATSTTFTCPLSAGTVGVVELCTATVANVYSGYNIEATGTVTFSGTLPPGMPTSCSLTEGTGNINTCPDNWIPASGTEGSYSISASYIGWAGDSTHGTSSTISPFSLTIQTATSTSVGCSPSVGTVGVLETCTATVTNVDSGYDTEATGTVTFSGTLPPGMPTSCSLTAGTGTSNTCTATWTPASGTEGSYSIGASYAGDSTHGASSTSSPFSLTIQKTTTSTTVTCSPSTGVEGVVGTCTATVSGYHPSGTVSWSQVAGTGSVTVSPASCILSSINSSSSECLVSVTGESLGPVTLEAAYGGDSNNLPSSATLLITVGTVTVACTPAPVAVGTGTTCMATVMHPSTPVPTGKVAWSTSGSGKFSALTCKLSWGSCNVAYIPTSPGTVTITASYGGDKYNPVSSRTFSLTVTQKASTTTVSCSPTSVVVGSTKTIKCTVHVTGYLPAGSVSWSDNGTGSVTFSSTTCSLSATGRCSVTMTATAAGSVTIHAAYGGDGNNTPSSGTAGLTIKQAKTRLPLACTLTSKDVWDCTATLKGYYGSVAGEAITWTQTGGIGIVSFSSTTCIIPLQSCSVTVTGTSPGKATIEAVYAGDTNNVGSLKNRTLTIH